MGIGYIYAGVCEVLKRYDRDDTVQIAGEKMGQGKRESLSLFLLHSLPHSLSHFISHTHTFSLYLTHTNTFYLYLTLSLSLTNLSSINGLHCVRSQSISFSAPRLKHGSRHNNTTTESLLAGINPNRKTFLHPQL